jgi:5'(3')-deoxyribonucleotidase
MSRSKIDIAIDVDEVLAQFMPNLIEFHNNNYNTKLEMKDYFSYNFSLIWYNYCYYYATD